MAFRRKSEDGKPVRYRASDHTFAICAYGDSEYLQELITSLLEQTVRSRIIISTSTPSDYIFGIADRAKIPVYVNSGEPGIARDWNMAIRHAGTSLVTIAHQDDTYHMRYAEAMLDAMNSCTRPLIYFTNYNELRDGVAVESNSLLQIKRLLLFPLKIRRFSSYKIVKRASLAFGSSICCPSVTLNMDNLISPVFRDRFKSNLDWEAWERLSKLDGDFYYNSHILMSHRIHQASETSALIRDKTRDKEDLAMLEKFWPDPIAHFIFMLYRIGQKSNRV